MAVVNRKLLIPKVHYFLCFGAMGGILPFLMMLATQLGATPAMVGLIYSTLPFVVMVVKPGFGSLADKLQQKKSIFLACIALMTLSLFVMYFIPRIADDKHKTLTNVLFTCNSNGLALVVCGGLLGSNQMHRIDENSTFSVPASVSCNVTCFPVEPKSAILDLICQTTMHHNLCTADVSSNVSSQLLAFRADIGVARNREDGCSVVPLSNFEIGGFFPSAPSCSDSEEVVSPCDVACDDGSGNFTEPIATIIRRSEAEQLPEGDHGGGGASHHRVTGINAATFGLNREIIFLWLCMVCAWIGMGTLVSMGDTLVLDLMEDKASFGRQRLWGAVGWGLVSLVTGYLLDWASRGQPELDFTPGFFVTLVLGTLDLAFASQIKVIRVERPRQILNHVGRLFLNPLIALFALSVFLVGCLTGILWTFLIVYLNELGASQLLIGLTLAVECFLGEIPFFFVSGWLLKKIGHAQAMTLVLAIFGVRFVAYGFVSDPWMALPIELTQGITYGIFFTALATYPSLIAPANTQATLQGIFQGIFEGFGVGIGCFVGGIIYQSYGGAAMFLGSGLASGGFAVVFGLLQFWLSHKLKAGIRMNGAVVQGAQEEEKQEEMVQMFSGTSSG